jgi:hypothetical protein
MARGMVHGWHEEETFYDYSTRQSKNSRQILHFSQLVWRDSSQLGCALVDCSDDSNANFPARIYCCKGLRMFHKSLQLTDPDYDPIGNNVAGNYFAENVWPPICADPSKAELEARFGF